jgi:hypothetical protein
MDTSLKCPKCARPGATAETCKACVADAKSKREKFIATAFAVLSTVAAVIGAMAKRPPRH